MFPNQCLSTTLRLPVPMFTFPSPLEPLGVIFIRLLTCSFFPGLQVRGTLNVLFMVCFQVLDMRSFFSLLSTP